MRQTWSVITVLLALLGFVIPIVWAGAIITGILAIGSAPPGKRADGKPRSGGLLGGVIDDFAVKRSMMECPACKMMMRKDATICPHCRTERDPEEVERYAAKAFEKRKIKL